MSKLNLVRRCYNCGAVLQDQDPKKPGYISPEIFGSDATILLCNDCYSQQCYDISPKEPKADPEFLCMLKDAQASDAMIVYVVDVFSFESSFISAITDAIRGLKILVVANKRDLLPSNYSDEFLKEYVAHRFRVAKISVKADDVVLASLSTMGDIREIANEIEHRRKRHDVYVIGAQRAGKTILISSFLRSFNNKTKKAITTIQYPGTKQRVLEIPLDSSSYLYDTPGTSIENSMLSVADVSTIHQLTPLFEVGPRPVTLNQGESAFIGGVARVDLIKGQKQVITGYFSRDVAFGKCAKNIDASFIRAIERGTAKPVIKGLADLTKFDAFDIVVDETGERDIGIEGLGWFSFLADGQTFRVYVPKGVAVYTSRAKIHK